ncbi:MAG: hypothetical protein IJX97_02050 [Clostridia bacterium]|nr:hypothetical protein [Clostridia bacterium]
MKNAEKLYYAIGEIDDNLISEASVPYKKAGQIVKRIVKAASITIVTTLFLFVSLVGGLLFGTGGFKDAAPDSNGGAMAPAPPENGEADDESIWLSSSYGRIRLETVSHNSIGISLYLDEDIDTPIDFTLYSKDKAFAYSTVENAAQTVYEPTVYVYTLDLTEMPTEKGYYRIFIYFGNMSEEIEWENYVEFDDFGRLYID